MLKQVSMFTILFSVQLLHILEEECLILEMQMNLSIHRTMNLRIIIEHLEEEHFLCIVVGLSTLIQSMNIMLQGMEVNFIAQIVT